MKAIPPSVRSPRQAGVRVRDSAGGEAGAPLLPEPGDIVAGKYRIEKVVGEGGMGVVYAAHHMVLDQRVALKLLLVDSPSDGETVERFVREAQAAARLRSEHVVRVTDAGALESGLPFLVMEYLQGCDLAELACLDGPLPAADVADYMLQVLAALAQAHTAGIVHRDLKPANLFLALRDDGSNIIKVLDFGISKQRSERTRWKELTGKAVLGTPAYMSPEQLRSSKTVDARADIWSLGVSMYELLSGELPFDGDGPGEIFAAILEKTPISLRARCPDLPLAWDHIVMRCLERSPDARFADVGEMARMLGPLGSNRWAHAVSATERVLTRSRRSSVSTDSDLSEVAVAAGIGSSPPPALLASAAMLDAGQVTLGTGKTLVADLMTLRVETTRRRALWPAVAAAAALVIAVVGMTSRGESHSRARPAPARSLAAGGNSGSPTASPAFVPAAASSAGLVVGVSAQPDETPTSTTPPPSIAIPIASPTNRRAPAKKAPLDPRPKFLKSWR